MYIINIKMSYNRYYIFTLVISLAIWFLAGCPRLSFSFYTIKGDVLSKQHTRPFKSRVSTICNVLNSFDFEMTSFCLARYFEVNINENGALNDS